MDMERVKEGKAVLLDSRRIGKVKDSMRIGKGKNMVNDFWTDRHRYRDSGSDNFMIKNGTDREAKC
jgi:allantoicase